MSGRQGVEKCSNDNLPGEAGKPKFLDIHDRANLEFTWTYPNCLLRPKAGKGLQETGLAEGRSGEVY
jgi:hypothetical protein